MIRENITNPRIPSASSIDAHAHRSHAAHWAAIGRPDYAAHYYSTALDVDPHDTSTRMLLAECLVRCDRPDQAAGHYLQIAGDYAKRRFPQEARLTLQQALDLDSSQFVSAAVTTTIQCLGRCAGPLCTRAAHCHLAAGRVAHATAILQLGAQVDRYNPQIHWQLAQLYLSERLIDDALKHLIEAAQLFVAAGHDVTYIRIAEQILMLEPNHRPIRQELSRAYLRMGQPRRAVHHLIALRRASPSDEVGFEILAHAFAVIGRTSVALDILRQTIARWRTQGRWVPIETLVFRAQHWRPNDLEFSRAVIALRRPSTSSAPAMPLATPGATSLECEDDSTIVELSEFVALEVDDDEVTRRRYPCPDRPRPRSTIPTRRLPAPHWMHSHPSRRPAVAASAR